MTTAAEAWAKWRHYVLTILDQGRPMTEAERAEADRLVKEAKAAQRREERKARRLAAGGTWHE